MVSTRNAKRKQKQVAKRDEPKDEESSDSEVVAQKESDEEMSEEDESEEESSDDDGDSEDDNDENDESGDDEEMEEDTGPVEIKPVASANGEQCTFDLYNLLATNSHQVDVSKLYSKKKKKQLDEDITIGAETMTVTVNEDHLLDKATDGCMQLINSLWQLPTERSDAGPLVNLPGFSETKLPRQLVRFFYACAHVHNVYNNIV